MKKILIDARHIGKTGIGRYVYEIINTYARSGSDNDIQLIVNYRHDNIKIPQIIVKSALFTLKEQIEIGRIIVRERAHIFYSPYLLFPLLSLFTKTSVVIVVHDLIYIKNPSFMGYGIANLYFQIMFRLGVYYSDRIICISEFTMTELTEYFHNNKIISKTAVIWNGCSLDLFESETSKNRLNSILCVSTSKPWKRLDILVDAFNCLISENRIPQNTELIIVGNMDVNNGYDIKKHIESTICGDRVKLYGLVDDKVLDELYRVCNCLVHTSEYEGFGLVVWEAQARGSMVIVNDIPVNREIFGSSVLYYEYNNYISLSHVIEMSIYNSIRPSELPSYHSWDQTVLKMDNLFRNI